MHYSPRTATNCKSWRSRSERERRNQRARQVFALIVRGAKGHQCLFITLVKGIELDPYIRVNEWHRVLTRIRQHRQWRHAQALTTLEHGEIRRLHLHIVLKGVPGLTEDWLNRALAGTGITARVKPVDDVEGLAHYLTKKLTDPRAVAGWPRYFRPVTCTRGWCPEWASTRPTWQKLSHKHRAT